MESTKWKSVPSRESSFPCKLRMIYKQIITRYMYHIMASGFVGIFSLN